MDSKEKYRSVISTKIISRSFSQKQSKKVKAKIIWTFQLIEEIEKVPESYLKHIESPDGLYEIRNKI
jgi:hypothetical protein